MLLFVHLCFSTRTLLQMFKARENFNTWQFSFLIKMLLISKEIDLQTGNPVIILEFKETISLQVIKFHFKILIVKKTINTNKTTQHTTLLSLFLKQSREIGRENKYILICFLFKWLHWENNNLGLNARGRIN